MSVAGVFVTRGMIWTERGPEVSSVLKMFKVFHSDLSSRS